MPTVNKNFSRQQTPSIIDTQYIGCNFFQDQPDEVDGKKVGVRLFPGDDTPRHFERCNLINCLVAPGSTFHDCNTAIVEYDVLMSEDVLLINGVEINRKQHKKSFVHGRYLQSNGQIEHKPAPIEID